MRDVDTDAAVFVEEARDAVSFVFRDPFGNRLQAFEQLAAARPLSRGRSTRER